MWLGPRWCSSTGVSPLLLFLVWHRRPRLWFFLRLVPRFAAVGDFGEKLTDALDVKVGPEVNSHFATGQRFWLGNLSSGDVCTQCCGGHSKPFGGLCRGIVPTHTRIVIRD